MVENTECQRDLYGGLVSAGADAVSAVARKYGASGWKVNGAGGAGGSLTILASRDDGLKRKMLQAIATLGKGIRPLPASLSPGKRRKPRASRAGRSTGLPDVTT